MNFNKNVILLIIFVFIIIFMFLNCWQSWLSLFELQLWWWFCELPTLLLNSTFNQFSSIMEVKYRFQLTNLQDKILSEEKSEVPNTSKKHQNNSQLVTQRISNASLVNFTNISIMTLEVVQILTPFSETENWHLCYRITLP